MRVGATLWEVEVQAPAVERSLLFLLQRRVCLLGEGSLDNVLHLLLQRGLPIGVEGVAIHLVPLEEQLSMLVGDL